MKFGSFQDWENPMDRFLPVIKTEKDERKLADWLVGRRGHYVQALDQYRNDTEAEAG